MQLNPNGRNWGSLVNWDDLGKLYAGFIIAWTIILAAGISWLIVNRRVPSVKIRNVWIGVAAVAFLHVYLVKIFLAYTTNGHFTCSAEFWIMSIYLPFGIALFQANTVQLESISEEQQLLLRRESDLSQYDIKRSPRQTRTLWHRWCAATAAERTYVYIGIGMLIQLIITGVLYATSPELQGDWSSYGHISYAKGQSKCRRSLEWIPSAFWQLFWSWVYGPYILYKIRNINDVHYWRLQVFLTVIPGLPGVPLWLVAVYAPPSVMKPVNRWWVPPMWLAPGIIVMQAVTIFIPIYETLKDRSQLQTTLGILETWEASRKSDEVQSMSTNNTSLTSSSYDNKRISAVNPDPGRRKSEMYTMAALEKALAVNPQPLLQFAATQDFTAENIVFLMHVRQWHTEWERAITHDNGGGGGGGTISAVDRGRLSKMALEIYMTSVCETTAEFPVNIAGRIRSALDDIFRSRVPDTRGSSTSTFNSFDAAPAVAVPMTGLKSVQHIVMRREVSTDSGDTLWEVSSSSSSAPSSPVKPKFDAQTAGAAVVESEIGTAGEGITKSVFDEAEASIKYLVLTNTWQKLVKAHDHLDMV